MSLRDRAELAGYVMASLVLRKAPLATLQRLAERAARFVFDRQGKSAREAMVNLRVAYPELDDEQRAEIGRQSYVHFAWNMIDFARSERWSENDASRRVDLVGVEHLQKALGRGKGALMLTLHLGNFELAVRAFSEKLGLRPALVAREQRNSLLYERVTRGRTRTGADLIDRRKAAPSILRALRAGRPVSIMLDQYSRRTRAVFVPLFGARCSTSAGLATLALRTGAPVIPGYVVRDGPDHHVVTLLPELELPDTGDRKADIEAGTARCNQVTESIIRKYPEQWMWGHRRFRHSPDLPPDPYGDGRG